MIDTMKNVRVIGGFVCWNYDIVNHHNGLREGTWFFEDPRELCGYWMVLI